MKGQVNTQVLCFPLAYNWVTCSTKSPSRSSKFDLAPPAVVFVRGIERVSSKKASELFPNEEEHFFSFFLNSDDVKEH